jgi:nucleotide-binding universal stress UspA family protein
MRNSPERLLFSELTVDPLQFPIKHILVPYDDSKYANHAFQFALSLAKQLGASVSIITIMKDNEYSKYPWVASSHETVIDEKRLESLNKLFQSFELDAKENKISLKSEIITSSTIANSIILFASKKKADLIIMGTRGRSGALPNMRLGSVAIDVSQNSKCPVMLVH